MRRTVVARVAVLGATAVLALAGCTDEGGSGDGESGDGDTGGDRKPSSSTTDPLEVSVGEAFTWNDFVVADGWTLEKGSMARAEDQGTMPLMEGEVTNEGDETRFVLMQFNFIQGDTVIATVPCTTEKLAPDASAPLDCSGLSSSYPEAYDTVTVSEISD